MRVHTIGAVIREGEILMDIVPEDERLVIEAKVSTIDIDRVAIGQTADINFSAFKRRETKRILGRLINLSADSIVDENDPEQRPYYQAVVEITREGLQQLAGLEGETPGGVDLLRGFRCRGQRRQRQPAPGRWPSRMSEPAARGSRATEICCPEASLDLMFDQSSRFRIHLGDSGCLESTVP